MQHRASWLAVSLLAASALAACSRTAPDTGADQPFTRAEHPGLQVYQTFCAGCHERPGETRAPNLEALRKLDLRGIRLALTQGTMKMQGAMLTTGQQIDVASYLSRGEAPDNSWIAAHACTDARKGVDLSAEPTVARFGIDAGNQRRQNAQQAGLTRTQLADLELAWAFGLPGNASLRAQPAIVGEQLFLATPEAGQLYALDIGGETPCVEWVYEPGTPLRSAVTYGELPSGRKVLAFSDGASQTHLIDATTGEPVWKKFLVLGTGPNSTTGAPILHDDRLYVPISGAEITIGAQPQYECCRGHGGVIALDAASGTTLWEMHTMPDAKPTRVSRVGTQLWGPSGAPIWTTPAIDVQRGQLYVGTGENTSEPATDTSDSVLAVGLADGSIRWKHQGTANDVFLVGCMTERNGPNCPSMSVNHVDYDFGASIMLTQRSDGRDIVLAGQKSGVLWALEPDTGKLLWSADLGPGGPAGGIHWGLATDGRRVFAGINRVSAPGEDLQREPGLHAVDIDTGKVVWSWFVKPDCDNGRRERMPSCATAFGLSAAPLVIDGAVVQGGLDGYVRIFDGESGRLLWRYDTGMPFQTVNGVEARGGSIDNATIVAANGLLLVGSGYGLMGQQAGNVLLAFKATQP